MYFINANNGVGTNPKRNYPLKNAELLPRRVVALLSVALALPAVARADRPVVRKNLTPVEKSQRIAGERGLLEQILALETE